MVQTSESTGNLLLKPGNEKLREFQRQQVEYEDLTAEFNDKFVDFSKQFYHIYAVRLAELKEVLLPRVDAKWSKFCTHNAIFYLYKNFTFNILFVRDLSR